MTPVGSLDSTAAIGLRYLSLDVERTRQPSRDPLDRGHPRVQFERILHAVRQRIPIIQNGNVGGQAGIAQHLCFDVRPNPGRWPRDLDSLRA